MQSCQDASRGFEAALNSAFLPPAAPARPLPAVAQSRTELGRAGRRLRGGPCRAAPCGGSRDSIQLTAGSAARGGPRSGWAHGRAGSGWAPSLFRFTALLPQMNGAQDAAEPAPVWERPWSLEEIRKGSQSWSLASDAGVSGRCAARSRLRERPRCAEPPREPPWAPLPVPRSSCASCKSSPSKPSPGPTRSRSRWTGWSVRRKPPTAAFTMSSTTSLCYPTRSS